MMKSFFSSCHLFHLLFDRIHQRVVVQNIFAACLQGCCACTESNEQVCKVS